MDLKNTLDILEPTTAKTRRILGEIERLGETDYPEV